MSDYDAAFAAAMAPQGGGASPYDDIFNSLMPTARAPVKAVAEPVNDFSGNLRIGPLDTGIHLPDSVNKRLAQVGSGLADVGLAAHQIFGDATPQDATEKRSLDAKLNTDLGGKALNFLGQVAPSFAIPVGWAGMAGRAAPVVEGLVAGGLQGAFTPVAPGESRAFNTGMGAGFGAAIPAAVQGFRAMATPKDAELARKAIDQYGIPLGVADVTDSKTLKATRSILNDLPITGTMGANDQQAVQAGFNRAVGQTFGAQADSLTPAVMQASKSRIGGELDRIWNNNNVKVDGQFVQALQDIRAKTASLNPEQAAAVEKQIQNLLGKVNPAGEIPGSFANNYQSELRLIADGEKGLHQKLLNDLRQTVIGTFNRSVAGPEAQALAQARNQYAAFKTVNPLMNKAEAGVGGKISGDVPASLLPQAVVSQYGDRVAQSPFADLSQIGSRFLVDRTPQTGGSMRGLLQNGGLGASLVGAAHFGVLPQALTGMGVGIGTQGLLGSTKVANAMLSPQVARSMLANPQLSPALRELAMASLSRVPAYVGTSLLATPALE